MKYDNPFITSSFILPFDIAYLVYIIIRSNKRLLCLKEILHILAFAWKFTLLKKYKIGSCIAMPGGQFNTTHLLSRLLHKPKMVPATRPIHKRKATNILDKGP